jgi:hypothetical protein
LINVHLNGDIVRCPDIAAIRARLEIIKNTHKICKYNCKECHCKVFNNYQLIHKEFLDKRCPLAKEYIIKKDKDGFKWKIYNCPAARRQYICGLKQKNFQIDGKVYRKISSGAHYMIKESDYKTIFITLTFPPFKKKPDEKNINQCFSKFAENLHENYNVKYYIAVRENCPTSGRPHFHMLLSIPFTDFTILNSVWCSAISDISSFAPNALQTNPGKVILYNPRKALRYVCKYFSKARGIKSKSRVVFLSMPLILKAKKEYCCVEDILEGYRSIYINRTSDFTTCYRITDRKEFDRFCNQYLYALFELSDKKTNFTGVLGSLN